MEIIILILLEFHHKILIGEINIILWAKTILYINKYIVDNNKYTSYFNLLIFDQNIQISSLFFIILDLISQIYL